MKLIRFGAPVLALALAFAMTPAHARMFHRANRTAQNDSTFASKAAAGGMAEVRMAELAKTKAQSQVVKDLANRIYTDHTKANDDLKPIASKENLTVPTAMDAKGQAEYNKLNNLSGADFDKEYVNYEIKDHKEDIVMFQHEADHGTNADVKSWASQNLPTLREHLNMAENARTQIMK
jgi:putative membrane protein